MNKLFGLNKKVAVVTGSNGQLGKCLCAGLKQAGARVIGLDLEVNRNITEGIEYLPVDITNKAELKKVFDKIGFVDILVNNAGVSTFEPFEKRPEDKFDWVMGVNLKGTFFCIQNYVDRFDKNRQKSGSIVNIGSVFGVISPDFRNYTDCDRKNSEIYGATKAGIIQMTKYFAVHLAGRNIRVNAVSPGGIYNPNNPQGEDFVKNYSFKVPMQRMANDEELIGAVLYLAGPSATYTTGQNIVVDGGMTAW